MPDLMHSLQGRDLGFLRIIALLWGIELKGADTRSAQAELVEAMHSRDLVSEVVESLPLEAHQGLQAILQAEGRLPWAMFTRRSGAVREMGPARRDRERPHLAPVSPAEILWYRGLVSRAFFDTGGEPQEFAFIPDDLAPLLPALRNAEAPLPGRAASPYECVSQTPASDRILDQICTLLAALRNSDSLNSLPEPEAGIPWKILQLLAGTTGLLEASGMPHPETGRAFLEARRSEALLALVTPWLASQTFNELRQLTGLACEGEWSNDPVRARRAILDFLARVPAGQWWSLPSFLASIKERYPDFQRPAGDYDSWFIRDLASGEYLHGFAAWDAVDGALVRYLVTGPLHWLGMVDLASPSAGGEPSAFQVTPAAAAMLAGNAPADGASETGTIHALLNGKIKVARLAPRPVRYQAARFGIYTGFASETYTYQITPAALERARKQGLRTSHLIGLLRRHSASPVPPALVQALDRWEQNGVQAKMESVQILKVRTPEVIEALRRSRAGRFLGDLLGPTTIVINSGAHEKVLAALAEMGYLAEVIPPAVAKPDEGIISNQAPQPAPIPNPRGENVQ